MERKGGCCLAPRHSAGGQPWQMGRIMLRFRPIAPKPAGMAPAPVMAVAAGKGKRRAVAGGSGRRGRKPKKAATFAALMAAPMTQKVDMVQVQVQEGKKDHPLSSPSSSSSGMTFVDSSPATLPLMPVLPAEEGARRQVVSWVTVEDVTGTWRDGEAPSATASGGDEAPAFVSDQWGRVTWMNVAFHRAVSGGGDGDAAMAPSAAASEVRVLLAAKDGAAVPPWGTCAGFTGRVRVPYACPRRGSLIAPCDVWLLDAGGYLWRLDLQAALSLSLGGLL